MSGSRKNLTDKEFIKKWVEPEGVRLWQEYVLGKSDGIDKTPQWAETICGVPAETIIGFARLYARSKPVNLNTAWDARASVLRTERRQGRHLPAGMTGNTMSPGATASVETGGEFGQHKPLVPKPTVDWKRSGGDYRGPL